jgi:hypothetical protein
MLFDRASYVRKRFLGDSPCNNTRHEGDCSKRRKTSLDRKRVDRKVPTGASIGSSSLSRAVAQGHAGGELPRVEGEASASTFVDPECQSFITNVVLESVFQTQIYAM